jgi:hypothetical protein
MNREEFKSTLSCLENIRNYEAVYCIYLNILKYEKNRVYFYK